jgi:methylenetetrahydrofolate dehydrogenase (NADP+)/methenyltetrahydrofolate cyclohydrolase
MATLIDGKKIADEIKNELSLKVARLKAEGKTPPGLATIIVGDDPASHFYVNSKSKACTEVGFVSKIESLDAQTSEEILIDKVKYFNSNEDYHGILVQLPLPKWINEQSVIEAIDKKKDVDGFHPESVGNLVIGNDSFFPCTPYGIVELLLRYKIKTEGKHVVIVGRSNIVGKPIANLLLQKRKGANAIVTICHSAADDLTKYTIQADILIAAIGKPNFIRGNMVKENAVVIDVGINRVEDQNSKKGYKIVGDVNFDEVEKKSSYITPVPGGVGPMTIAMLLENTYKAYINLTKN